MQEEETSAAVKRSWSKRVMQSVSQDSQRHVNVYTQQTFHLETSPPARALYYHITFLMSLCRTGGQVPGPGT